MGYTRAEIPLDNVHGIAVTGGSFPAEMWRLFMEPALGNVEPAAFPEPKVWPMWKPFTRGEYALEYDPTPASTETVDTESSTSRPPPTPASGR